MTKNWKIGIAVVSTLLLASGSGLGLWMAWDQGLIGTNPRAPVVAAMENAVRRQAVVNAMNRDSGATCVAIELNHPAPEVTGFPGIALRAAPGQYAVTLLRQTNFSEQPGRDNQLRQMEYLASQGLLVAEDSIVVTDEGPRPARSYQMTWAGFSAMQHNQGSSLCLPYGRREFVRIETIEKQLENVLDFEVYEATYLSRVVDVPAWASTAEASALFAKLPQLLAETQGKAKVVRTKGGWRSAYEVEQEVGQFARGTATPRSLKPAVPFERGVPTLNEVKDLARARAADTDWASQYEIACLPLQIQRGGDDKVKPEVERDRTAAYTVTYYDRGDRKEREYQAMAKALHALSALEGAGLAEMEQLKAVPVPKGMDRRDASSVSPMSNGGVRYRVSRQAVEALEMYGNSGGCVPAGRVKVDVLAVLGNRGVVQIAARGRIEQTPEWVGKISERLPMLKSLIETGLPFSGQVFFAADQGPGRWRLTGLSRSYPEANYTTIPAQLGPLLPQTAAAFSAKSIKAPALVQPQTFLPSEPPPVVGAGPSPQPTTVLPPQLAAAARPVAGDPPYPVHGDPLHVISIYQGTLPAGVERGFKKHPEGVVHLRVDEPDAALLLLAYEPVEWRIKAANGIALKQVIAIGHYQQRVTLDGGGKPQVVTSQDRGLLRPPGIDPFREVPTGGDANDLVDIATISRALTGTVPHSYQGRNDLSATGFVIGPQTPRFALPARKTPHPGTAVHLIGDAVEGNRLLRGAAGAFTDAWSNLAYSGGKVYFEGRMRVTGALTAHPHANIGVCLARGKGIETSTSGGNLVIRHSEQKLCKDGDIFGIAADLEQQRLYYQINGVWVTGPPGSGNGIPLAAGKEYRACSMSAGTVIGEVQRGIPQSDTTWEMNFGESPFSQTLPAGYVPFRGH